MPMNCPKCGAPLKPVPPSSNLNSEQWDAAKAGDWYRSADACSRSNDCLVAGEGRNPAYRYATERGIAAFNDAEAERFGW